MTAAQLLGLLAEKHASDIFVPECKDGPTLGTTHFRMDAWAMTRSWSNDRTIGYEIKVSRSDFTRDDKWHGYLDCCNEFYFVCPQGLIKPDELPAEAGILWASKTGTRLFMKKRAPRREVSIPEPVWRYILMSRAIIQKGCERDKSGDRDYWARWMAQKKENRDFGYRVSSGIRKLVQERITEVQQESVALERRMREYDDLRGFIRRVLGIELDNTSTWAVERNLRQLMAVVPPDLDEKLAGAADAMKRLVTELEKLKGKSQTEAA